MSIDKELIEKHIESQINEKITELYDDNLEDIQSRFISYLECFHENDFDESDMWKEMKHDFEVYKAIRQTLNIKLWGSNE